MQKRLIITGATSGIGKATIETLAHGPWAITLLARNEQKANEVIKSFAGASIEFIQCDLADLRSVKQAADEIKRRYSTIDVLVNNAGGIFQNRELSKDGYELTFAMNHLGHFLLTTELIHLLKSTKGSRIINISSAAHDLAKVNFDDLMLTHSYGSWRAYGTAKLFNIYFTKELHQRFNKDGVSSFCLHPGVVSTHFFNEVKGVSGLLSNLIKPFMISPRQGAATSLYLITTRDIEKYSGNYFKNKKVSNPSSLALNESNAKRLWDESEKLVARFR